MQDLIIGALASERLLSPGDFPRGFVNATPTFDSAWQMALATGALEHVPYPTRLELSRLYAQQARYEKQSELVGGLIYQALFEGGAQEVVGRPRSLLTLIATFVYREAALEESYDETLAMLESL